MEFLPEHDAVFATLPGGKEPRHNDNIVPPGVIGHDRPVQTIHMIRLDMPFSNVWICGHLGSYGSGLYIQRFAHKVNLGFAI